MYFATMAESPVGPLLLAADEAGLRMLKFASESNRQRPVAEPEPGWEYNESRLREPLRQLKAYFRKTLRHFDLPLAAAGTDFQKRVWQALCEVPYGETASYGDIARAIGRPTASRAVGMANGRNPIAIVIPCHRIIGSNGRLVGYGGGLVNKTTLLQLECSSTPRSR